VVQNISELAFKFQEVAEQAPLYAKKDTCLAIQGVVTKMNALAPQFENPPTPGDAVHPFDLSMTGLEIIYGLLTRDTRELLDLEPL
jgi:hypothetical protein